MNVRRESLNKTDFPFYRDQGEDVIRNINASRNTETTASFVINPFNLHV